MWDGMRLTVNLSFGIVSQIVTSHNLFQNSFALVIVGYGQCIPHTIANATEIFIFDFSICLLQDSNPGQI